MVRKREIYSQGDKDGACFLYSVANAATALMGKRITDAQWRKGILSLPFNLNNFLCDQGTAAFEEKELLLQFCSTLLSGLNVPIRASILTKASFTSLRKTVNKSTAVIACVDDGNHWVPIVDADDVLYVACSSRALNLGKSYQEETSPRLKRTYNLHGDI